jgi:hypothetical protein
MDEPTPTESGNENNENGVWIRVSKQRNHKKGISSILKNANLHQLITLNKNLADSDKCEKMQ